MKKPRIALLVAFAMLAVCGYVRAQTTTTVADTLRGPQGTTLSGRVTISNNATFTAADGTVVPKGTVAVVQVANGAFSAALVPNVGSTPSGTSYTATYALTGGVFLTETWVVPASGPVTLADVRTSPTPAPSAVLSASQLPALTGDVNSSAGSAATKVVELHWGSTGLTLPSSAPGDGQCLTRSGLTITGADCRTFASLSGQAIAAQLPLNLSASNVPQVFNVKAYGAAGTCAVDDYAAIHSAQLAAESAGGIIFFPPGCYLTNSTISFGLSDSGLIVTGSGRYYSTVSGTVIKWGGAANGTVIKVDGAYNLHLSDFLIDGNSTAGRGIDFIATSSSTSHDSAGRLKIINIGGTPGYNIGAGDGGGSGAVDNLSLSDIQGGAATDCYYQDGAQTYASIARMNCGNNSYGWNMQNGWMSVSGTSYYGGSGVAFNIAQTSAQMSVDDFDWEGTGEFLTVQDGSNYNYVYLNNIRGHYDGLAAQSIMDVGLSSGTSGYYSLTNSQFQSIHAGANATINFRQATAGLRFNDAGTSYTQTPATVTLAYPVGVTTHYSLNQAILSGSVAGSTTVLTANTCGDDVYLSLSGARTTMAVLINPQARITQAGFTAFGRVWATDSVQITYCNGTGSSLTPNAVTWNVRVIP